MLSRLSSSIGREYTVIPAFPYLIAVVILLFAGLPRSHAAEPPRPPQKPCTLKSPLTGAYFDFNSISLTGEGGKESSAGGSQSDTPQSWVSRGYDYGANFTLNVCAPVIEKLHDVVGIDSGKWGEVGAFYVKDNKTYSIGKASHQPIFRGRKMVLNYTDGSPCPGDSVYRSPHRTKSTIVSFLCDRETLPNRAHFSFVGTMDSCTYMFEARSAAACGGLAANTEDGSGPAGVFGAIALIALAAYFVGGCAYQRTVMHQRGWRQCPNYALWASLVTNIKRCIMGCIVSFIYLFRLDRFRIFQHQGLTNTSGDLESTEASSETSLHGDGPHARSNRHRANSSPGRNHGGSIGYVNKFGAGRGRGRSNVASDTRGPFVDDDEENRLIDQFDEEWNE